MCAFPETSATVTPVPSLNAYAATRPLEAAADPPGQPGSARMVRVRVRTYGRLRPASGHEGFLTIWDGTSPCLRLLHNPCGQATRAGEPLFVGSRPRRAGYVRRPARLMKTNLPSFVTR